MAKLQGYDHDISCVVDPELQRLFYKRARAKYKVYLDIEYITPLFATGPENANSLVFRIDDSIEEVEPHLEDLKLAHREYVKKILEDISEDEEEMNEPLGE